MLQMGEKQIRTKCRAHIIYDIKQVKSQKQKLFLLQQNSHLPDLLLFITFTVSYFLLWIFARTDVCCIHYNCEYIFVSMCYEWCSFLSTDVDYLPFSRCYLVGLILLAYLFFIQFKKKLYYVYLFDIHVVVCFNLLLSSLSACKSLNVNDNQQQ